MKIKLNIFKEQDINELVKAYMEYKGIKYTGVVIETCGNGTIKLNIKK